jgi:hypothetical protein
MATIIGGIVKSGLVVPDSPLPEGARVEIVLSEVEPELQTEFEAWDRASAQALDLVERLAQESDTGAER